MAGGVAHAQEGAGILYLDDSRFIGSSRASSLGGAYVAIAEGGAYTSNLAAIAHPPRTEGDVLDLGLTVQPLSMLYRGGLPQDGRGEEAPDPVTESVPVLLGGAVRYGHVALGAYARGTRSLLSHAGSSGPDQPLRVREVNAGAAVGFWLDGGAFVAAVGPVLSYADLMWGGRERRYLGLGVLVDVLYRPVGRPYRLGAAVRPGILAEMQQTAEAMDPVFQSMPLRAASPQELSFGFSMRLGEGSHLYNVPTPRSEASEDDGSGSWTRIFRARDVPNRGRWLMSLQLDVTSPVADAVSVRSLLPVGTTDRVGARFRLTPRVGVEHVTLPGRLQLRAGTYLQSLPEERQPALVHVTAGFELFLVHLLADWALIGTVDVSARGTRGSLALGFFG